ncbi:MAG TPA: hypothetical protein VGK31_04725 [Thermoanaerobaculia bacterium]|jgi:hypothetical protein
MREVIIPFDSKMIDRNGTVYHVRVIGFERPDGMWEGCVEFETESGGRVRTGVETTQPNGTDLEDWATSFEPDYLESALARAALKVRHAVPHKT